MDADARKFAEGVAIVLSLSIILSGMVVASLIISEGIFRYKTGISGTAILVVITFIISVLYIANPQYLKKVIKHETKKR